MRGLSERPARSRAWRRAAFLALLTLLWGCGAREPEAGPRTGDVPVLRVADYFPAPVGARWRYAGRGNEFAAYTQAVTHRAGNVVQIVAESGTSIAYVYEVTPDRIVRLYRSGEMDELRDVLDERDADPYVLLEGPLEAGREWVAGPVPGAADRPPERRRIEAVGAAVTTPAGTFENVLQIRVIRPGGTDSREYYAPGVGLIQSEFLAEEPILSSLSFFSLGDERADPYLP